MNFLEILLLGAACFHHFIFQNEIWKKSQLKQTNNRICTADIHSVSQQQMSRYNNFWILFPIKIKSCLFVFANNRSKCIHISCFNPYHRQTFAPKTAFNILKLLKYCCLLFVINLVLLLSGVWNFLSSYSHVAICYFSCEQYVNLHLDISIQTTNQIKLTFFVCFL